MQTQSACLLLLCLTCFGLCTDVDQEQRALEEELLSSLFTSKMKQNRQNAPYWRLSVSNLCRMLSSLGGAWQEAWDSAEEQDDVLDAASQDLKYLLNLANVCRALQSREERLLRDSLEYFDGEQKGDAPLKRKSPYILKRQVAQTTKSRRPYILKRSTFY